VKLGDVLRPLKIVHAALMVSIVIYAVIAFVVTAQSHPAKPPLDPTVILPVFAAMALAMLVAIPIVRKRVLPPMTDTDERIDAQQEVDPDVSAMLGKLRGGLITTWAMCESIAIFGLIAAFLFHTGWYVLPFAGVAIVAQLFYAPTEAVLGRAVRAMYR
jgi:hypothetical protein